MFDLEKSIFEWRQQMLVVGIKAPVPLEELEIHLHEEIERQMKSGLNEQKAFEIAVQKIGQARAVQNEFKKVDKTHSALKWKLMEISLTLATILVPLLFGGIVLKRASCIDMTAAEEFSSLTALVAFSLLAWSGRLGHRFLPVIQNRRIRDAILFSCCVPLMLWWVVFLGSSCRAMISRWVNFWWHSLGRFLCRREPALVCLGESKPPRGKNLSDQMCQPAKVERASKKIFSSSAALPPKPACAKAAAG
jgi:hypothetical protein